VLVCGVIGCIAVRRQKERAMSESWGEDEGWTLKSICEAIIMCPCATYVCLSDCEDDARRNQNKGGFKGDYFGDPSAFLEADPLDSSTMDRSTQPTTTPLIDPRLDGSF